MLVSSLPGKWPLQLVLPICYGYCVGGVHSLVHAGNVLDAPVDRPVNPLSKAGETTWYMLVSSLPWKWPLVLPVCYGYCVGGVHSLVHAGNIYWPKQGHACIADQNWYCPGCVDGAGRSENIRVKSKDVECWLGRTCWSPLPGKWPLVLCWRCALSRALWYKTACSSN